MSNSKSKTLEDSVTEMVDRLCQNKQLPKYQFERCSDVFISMFLGDWLKDKVKEDELVYVANEFPLKKDKNCGSTNVDLLYVGKSCLYFVELKTDSSSFSQGQISSYLNHINKKTSSSDYIDPINAISEGSDKNEKYQHLISRLKNMKNMNIQFILVSPEDSNLSSDGKILGFNLLDFINCKELDTPHCELWSILQPKLAKAFGLVKNE